MQQKGLFNHSSARHGLHRPTVIRLKLKLPSGCFSAANTEKDVPDLSVLMSPTWYFNIVVRQAGSGVWLPTKKHPREALPWGAFVAAERMGAGAARPRTNSNSPCLG